MAEFCKQCSIEIFGEDYGDFAGLTTEQDTEGGYGMHVLCEGCGPAWIIHDGTCLHKYCLKKHGEQKEVTTDGD